jgi:hypothetical protein
MDKCVKDQVLLASQAATMAVCLVAIITLIFTALNTRANSRSQKANAGAQKARFLLDLRNTFMERHRTAAESVWRATLIPNNQNNVRRPDRHDVDEGPRGFIYTARTPVGLDYDMSLYMGTLELCEVMLEDGLLDVPTFFDAIGDRVEQSLRNLF